MTGACGFLDWEFAGMGDLYFDLATIAYAFDSVDTLSRDLQEYVLTCYFGDVLPKHRKRFEGMLAMLMFFSAMWGLVQFGMQCEGQIQAVEDFDYLEYAEITFEAMREFLERPFDSFVRFLDTHPLTPPFITMGEFLFYPIPPSNPPFWG